MDKNPRKFELTLGQMLEATANSLKRNLGITNLSLIKKVALKVILKQCLEEQQVLVKELNEKTAKMYRDPDEEAIARWLYQMYGVYWWEAEPFYKKVDWSFKDKYDDFKNRLAWLREEAHLI